MNEQIPIAILSDVLNAIPAYQYDVAAIRSTSDGWRVRAILGLSLSFWNPHG